MVRISQAKVGGKGLGEESNSKQCPQKYSNTNMCTYACLCVSMCARFPLRDQNFVPEAVA